MFVEANVCLQVFPGKPRCLGCKGSLTCCLSLYPSVPCTIKRHAGTGHTQRWPWPGCCRPPAVLTGQGGSKDRMTVPSPCRSRPLQGSGLSPPTRSRGVCRGLCGAWVESCLLGAQGSFLPALRPHALLPLTGLSLFLDHINNPSLENFVKAQVLSFFKYS